MMKNKSSLHLEFAGCFFVCFCLLYSFFCAREAFNSPPSIIIILIQYSQTRSAIIPPMLPYILEKSAKLFIYNEKSVVTNIQLRAENAEPGRTSFKESRRLGVSM